MPADRIPVNFFLKCMFFSIDIFYGRRPTLARFLVLEALSSCFYRLWGRLESVDVFTLGPDGKIPRGLSARKLVKWICLAREGRDMSRWHFLLLTDILRQQKTELGRFHYVFFPAVMAFKYRMFLRIVFRINPDWLAGMTASFALCLEQQYIMLARQNPVWDTQAVQSRWFEWYPEQRTLGDLVRRMALDQKNLAQSFLATDQG